MKTTTERGSWSGRALKRRARALLRANYGTLVLLGLISVLAGDWMGGWLRFQIQVGPLRDIFEQPIRVTKAPCKAYGPKLRNGVPVDLPALPEWPELTRRFELLDLNDIGWPETIASENRQLMVSVGPLPDSTNTIVIHKVWNADAWRVVRTVYTTTNHIDLGRFWTGTETEDDEEGVSVDSYEYRFRRVWHADLFGRPFLALRSPWAIAAFALASALLLFLVANPLAVEIRGRLLDVHRDDADAPKRPPPRWRHTAWVMLQHDFFVLLWSLLLVVPGVVKAYEWRLVPFLLADDPSLGWREAARMSGERMAGQKLDAFWLDLSFIGWWLLGSLSFGVLNILLTVPYYGLTLAGLYETLVRGLRLPPEPKTPYDEFEEALRTRI